MKKRKKKAATRKPLEMFKVMLCPHGGGCYVAMSPDREHGPDPDPQLTKARTLTAVVNRDVAAAAEGAVMKWRALHDECMTQVREGQRLRETVN